MGRHSRWFVFHLPRHEEDLRVRLSLAEDMPLSWRRGFEDDEELLGPPFALDMADHADGHRARFIGEESWVRLGADHVSRRALQVHRAVEEVEAGIGFGKEADKLAAGELFAGLGGKVPFEPH